LDGTRQPGYLVQVVPAFAALTALWLAQRMAKRLEWRLVIAGLAAIQLAAIGMDIHRNAYGHEYQPAAAFLKSRAEAGALIMGDAGFAFILGFNGPLVDDMRLGYFSGRTPQIFITTSFYDRWIERTRSTDPALHQHIRGTLDERFRKVFQNPRYSIYALRD
jgi:hypothetical protein